MTDHNHASHGNQDHAQGGVTATLHDVRDKASDTFASTKATAKDAAHRATEGLESNPLTVLVGGLAVGALAGALLPRSEKEKELLAPVGKRLGETAREALAAAKDAGKQELEGAGLSPNAARDRGKDLLGGLTKALSSAGAAAAQAAKGQTGQDQASKGPGQGKTAGQGQSSTQGQSAQGQSGQGQSGQGQSGQGQSGQQGGSPGSSPSASQNGAASSPTPMQA